MQSHFEFTRRRRVYPTKSGLPRNASLASLHERKEKHVTQGRKEKIKDGKVKVELNCSFITDKI